ncbi:MAG TPA: hypothetical protein VF774_28590, partial [Pseudoduganella sp.]
MKSFPAGLAATFRASHLAAVHSAMGVGLCMGMAGVTPAHAAGPATLVGSASGRCLDVAQASLEPRTPAI